MNAVELQKIEQRLKEGYYEADADTLRTMEELVAALRRLREETEREDPTDAALPSEEL
jgi:hypothetical protein